MKTAEAFAALEQGVHAALETYSNVHRGSGHASLVSTHLYEQAREIVLQYLGLQPDRYLVIFCTPRRATLLTARLRRGSYRILSSQEYGLAFGLRAVVVERTALPGGVPFETGGGTSRLVFRAGVVWARGADKFEAGTPAIVNVIAFARALRLIGQFGPQAFQQAEASQTSAEELLYQDELTHVRGQALLDQLRQSLIGRGLCVPTAAGSRPFINLDNGASTPTFAPIWQAVCQAWRQPVAVQQAIIQQVRLICARMLGAPLERYDLLFTSNTTEAINLLAESLRNESSREVKPVIVNTLLEHNSNELPWRTIPGASLLRLPVDGSGFVNLNQLEALLRAYNQQGQHGARRIKLVAVSGASNVLGVCNDLAAISRLAHQYQARLLVDAAQLVAHRAVAVEALGIDYLAFSAHKLYAPFGSGVLLARKGLLQFEPAELAQIRASGEENVGGIAGLGKALLLLERIGMDVIQQYEHGLVERALRGLAQIPGLTVYGITDPASAEFARKSAVIIFRMQGIMATQVAAALAEQAGIGVRSGCHCAHLLIKQLLQIPVAQSALQVLIVSLFPQLSLPGLTRVSLGIENTPDEIDALIEVLGRIASQPRAQPGLPRPAPQTPLQQQIDDFVRGVAQTVYT